LTAIDLTNKSVAWQVPFGTARDSGPLGSKTGPPITFGVFSMGGPTSTRSGLTFIGASLDQYIRAYDNRTGRELWRARLPAGGQSSPMTYWSEESSRQFVVIAAGGHGALQTAFGDHVIAYALPRTSTR
jgi:quinoprotein glucose dehydrogenase